MRTFVTGFSLIAMLVAGGCGVKVQTGQTPDEAVESSDRRADIMRREWASQLATASPLMKANMVATRIDSTAALFLGFGQQVIDEWLKANRGRGVEVPASEMREVVDAWIGTQRPIIDAHEDNINQGMREVEATSYFDRPILDKLRDMVRQYDAIYSAVFFPNGTVDDYNDALIRERTVLYELSEEVHRDLERYR